MARKPNKASRPRSGLAPSAKDVNVGGEGGEGAPFDPLPLDPFLRYTFVYHFLDPDFPILLLPIRLETRFDSSYPPRDLRVRVFPDQVHVDNLDRALSEDEMALGARFWRLLWRAGNAVKRQQAAWRWLVDQLGPWRAAWVARRLQPLNPEAAPSRPRREAEPLPVEPRFPEAEASDRQPPASTELLPSRWAAVGYLGGARRFAVVGNQIPPRLDLGLGGSGPAAADGLAVDPGLEWMVDFDEAVEKGMALRIPLADPPRFPEPGLDQLFVFGVREDLAPRDAAQKLVQLFEAHHYTEGMSFVPQGTATNNTATAASGWSARQVELDALLARELDLPAAAPDVHLRRQMRALRRSAATKGAPAAPAASEAGVAARGLGLPSNDLLPRLPGALDRVETPASDMNRLLGPAAVGTYFEQGWRDRAGKPLAPVDPGWLQDWFVRFVRAAGPLPCLRLGPQPYGVLPVMRLAGRPRSDREAWLQDLVARLRAVWRQQLADLPAMDPASGDGFEDPQLALRAILSRHPHARGVRLVPVEDRRRQVASEFDRRFGDLGGNIYLQLLGEGYNFRRAFKAEVRDYYSLYVFFWRLRNRIAALLDEIEKELRPKDIEPVPSDDPAVQKEELERALADCDAMLELILAHGEALFPLWELSRNDPSWADVTGADLPRLAFFRDTGEGTIWRGPWIEADDARSGGRARNYLTWLRIADSAVLQSGQPEGMTDPPPLLFQLARHSLAGTSGDGRAKIRAALLRLRSQPAEVLERLLLETLGLGAYRLDAWATSLATVRLARLRRKQDVGFYLGGFGWVENLRPSFGEQQDQGFIHAPSVQHAATAAVLRSGWDRRRPRSDADEPRDTLSPFALDLSSARMRLARWLLDGVRQGQTLGELLGARFERQLRDAGLADWIEVFRRLAARGGPPSDVVVLDGDRLLELWREADGLEELLLDVEGAAELEGARRVTTILKDLALALDAVADATVADSVHHLLQGNAARVAGQLSAISRGEAPPPELRMLDTPVAGLGVTHRLMILLPAEEAPSPWADTVSSARSAAAPRLEAWVARLLPAPGRVRAEVLYRHAGEVLSRRFVTLDELGLTALDAVFLAAHGDEERSYLHERLQRHHSAERPPTVPYDASVEIDPAPFRGPEWVTLEEFTLLVRALHGLTTAARPLRGSDLQSPAEESAELDDGAAEMDERLRRLEARLEEARLDLERRLGRVERQTLRELLLALSSFGFASALPRAGWLPEHAPADELQADLEALEQEAKELLSAIEARQRELAKPGAGDGRRQQTERLSLLLGGRFPLTPVLTLTDDHRSALAATFGRDRGRRDELAAASWLGQVAKVRTESARLDEVMLLADTLSGVNALRLEVGQLPDFAGEPWAAVAAPDPDLDFAGRLSLVAAVPGDTEDVFGAGGPRSLCGLMVDEWVETVPLAERTTGVAFNFDAPASRAPQTLLLAVPPFGQAWTVEHLLGTLRETLEWAKLRAVDPSALRGRRIFPAVEEPVGRYTSAVLATPLEAGEEGD